MKAYAVQEISQSQQLLISKQRDNFSFPKQRRQTDNGQLGRKKEELLFLCIILSYFPWNYKVLFMMGTYNMQMIRHIYKFFSIRSEVWPIQQIYVCQYIYIYSIYTKKYFIYSVIYFYFYMGHFKNICSSEQIPNFNISVRKKKSYVYI